MNREIEAAIAAYIGNNLLEEGEGPVAHDTSLAELGVLDSIAVAAILAFAEARFGVQIEENEIAIENVESVNAIAALVRQKLDAAGTSALGRIA